MTHAHDLKLFGIPHCTTVKKARAWLAQHGIPVDFHDFKKLGVDRAWARGVVAQRGLDAVVNTRGTTWRKLSDSEKSSLHDLDSALELMQTHPSVIKRPILDLNGTYVIGFSEQQYQALFGA